MCAFHSPLSGEAGAVHGTQLDVTRLTLSVGMLSSAALGYEVLLLRLFSEIWWQPFATTVISLALLGYGASGTVIALSQEPLLRCFQAAYRYSAFAYAATALACYMAAQRLPLNPLDLAWNLKQWGWFAVLYLMLALPFCLVGFCVGLALRAHGEKIPRIYSADLCGGGAGAALVLLLLTWLPPERVVVCVGLVACLAGVLLGAKSARSRTLEGMALFSFAMLLVFWQPGCLAVRQNPYKGISQQLRWPGAAVIAEEQDSLARVQVVAPGVVPLRHAAGLSLHCVADIPPQQAVFVDGEFAGALDLERPTDPLADYLSCLPIAAVHVAFGPRRVAVLGAGTGAVVSTALHYGAEQVIAVENNAPLVALLARSPVIAVERARLHLVHEQYRAYLARPGPQFDLLQVSTADAGYGGPPGILSTAEDFLFTVESLTAMLRRLEPSGALSITTGFEIPPKISIKLFATVVAALRAVGVTSPADCLFWFRSWNTATLIAVPGGLAQGPLRRLLGFCEDRAFDVCHYPGITSGSVNRFALLERPVLFEASQALLGSDAFRYLRAYPFYVTPARDDSPFFHRFFRWQLVPEILRARGRGGEGLLPWGYLLPVMSLAQSLIGGLALILLPLRKLGVTFAARSKRTVGAQPWLYFSCLGAGFMLVEVAVVKRFTLLLGNPVVAAAVTLSAFLVLAGLGSRHVTRGKGEVPVRPSSKCVWVATWIATAQVTWTLAVSGNPPPLLSIPFLVLAAAFSILAFVMGMPFPAGMSALAERSPDSLPWAWGMNGFASVWSAAAGALLAVHFGFSACLWLAVALYLAAAWNGRRWTGGDSGFSRAPALNE